MSLNSIEIQQSASIPSERTPSKQTINEGILPISLIDLYVKSKAIIKFKVEDKQQQQQQSHNIILNQTCPNAKLNNLELKNQKVQQTEPDNVHDYMDTYKKPNKDLASQTNHDEENPFSNIDLIENQQTASMNFSQYQGQASLKNIPKNHLHLNEGQSPKIVLSRFAVRKNEINLTSSVNNNNNNNGVGNKQSSFNNSKENEQIMYSGSQGWMHSQFNPQLDNKNKKEMYVIQKILEFQFDPAMAKGILEQIDIDKYSREEILQMVCETMINHCEEQRIGKRVIDKIQSSRFIHKLLPQKSNQSLKSPKKRQQDNLDLASDIQSFQPACSIGNSLNSNKMNIPQGNGNPNYLSSFNSRKENQREKSPSKAQKKSKNYIQSQIFLMPITHSQKVIKIENNIHDKVQDKLYTCEICYQEYLGSEFFRLTICQHNFCHSCTQTYLNDKINKSEVLSIVCPQQGCGIKLNDQQIQKFLLPNVFDRYMKLKKIMVINQDPSVRWCPTLDCETYMRGDKNSPCLSCPKCQQKMCFLCNQKWHQGDCEDAMSKSLVLIQGKLKIKQCPKCHGRIQKFEGCNHIKCWMCSYEFCWLCKKQYSKWHYKNWNVIGCPDLMFSDDQPEGFEKVCSVMGSVLRLLFFLALVLTGGIGALIIYVVLMFILAPLLPLFVFYHFFKEEYEELSLFFKILLCLTLIAGGFIFYPVCLFLCFIPGTCIFGPEIYMYILYIVYNEDMYN